jgi:peroxiredoxin
MTGEFANLPADLPRPVDDGAATHLTGMSMPRVTLRSTAGRDVDLGALGPGRTVIYCYPKTGLPGHSMPNGWDAIPGARGCTPQACAFRDHHRELADLSSQVFGLSTQSTDYQREMAERLHLPFEILSDPGLRATTALRLPTFEVSGEHLLKRLTLIVRGDVIERVFYPVFPPDKSADEVVQWIRARRQS